MMSSTSVIKTECRSGRASVYVHEDLPVSDNWFEALASNQSHTAAKTVPLVMWEDYIYKDRLLDSHKLTEFLQCRNKREWGVEENELARQVLFLHHDFMSLFIVREGRGTHIINGVPYGVARGDVYAMGLGMTHCFSGCDYLMLDALHFSPQIFDPPTLEALAETPGFLAMFVEAPLDHAPNPLGGQHRLHLAPDAYATIAEELSELKAEWASGTPSGTLMTSGLFLRLLVHLAREYARSRKLTDHTVTHSSALHEATVASAVRYIDEHFAEPIRIEQIAASVFLSPDRFTEVFANVMGRTPRDYLRYVRLERAKTLLRMTELSVTDIAHQAGFGDAAYLIRVFRAATGQTPGGYRKRGVSVGQSAG